MTKQEKTLEEKIMQLILDLNKESVKYPKIKTTDVIYMLSMLINNFKNKKENENK